MNHASGLGLGLGTVRQRLLASIEERPAPGLLLIIGLVVLLGIVKLWLNPPSFEFNWENRWWQIALNMARSDGYVACKPIYFPFCEPGDATAMREPLPVLLLTLIALLTDESLLAAAASGVILNVGILISVFLLTRELCDTRTGVLAALLWACYLPPVRVLYREPSGDLLAALAITCGMFHFMRARRTNRHWEWLAAGAWLGLAILSRSAALLIALVLTAGQLLLPCSGSQAPARSSARRVGPATSFAFAWLLIALPWYTRNYLVFDRPVIGSTLAGYYLYRQNHMLPSDDYLRFVSGAEFVPVLKAMIARRSDLRGTENEAEMDQVYRQEALRIIRAEPLRYLALSGYRFLMLWFDWGVKEVYRRQSTPGDYLTVTQHALLLAGGLLGLRNRWRRAWPLPLSIIVFSVIYMAAMAHLLYVVPVAPLLVTLSAIACSDLASSFGARMRKRALPA